MEVPRTEDGLSLTEDRCNKVMMKYMKEYGEAQQDLVHFSKVTTSILYDAGVISKKRYKELQKRWPNYIPMFRVFEDNEEVDFGDSLKHMHGSTRRIINPLDSIISFWLISHASLMSVSTSRKSITQSRTTRRQSLSTRTVNASICRLTRIS